MNIDMPANIYRLKDGTRAPGTTTINKITGDYQGLITWAYKCGLDGIDINKVRDDAAQAGSIGHLLVEAAIKRFPLEAVSFPTEGSKDLGMRAYKNYLEWQQRSNIKLIESEISLVSEKHRYGGTIDCLGLDGNQTCLLDIKTGGLYPEHLCQIAAYGQLILENRGIEIGRFHLCRFARDTGDFLHFSTDDLSDALEAFLLKRKLHELLAGLRKRI